MTDAVLFIHHLPLTEAVTCDHLFWLKVYNAGAEIIPLCFDGGCGTAEWQHRHCDELVFEWFRAFKPTHDRFFIIEYDTLCTQSLKDFYGAAYDLPAVGSIIVNPNSTEPLPRDSGIPKEWYWFTQNRSKELQPYLRGILPVCGAMFSRDALARMVELWLSVKGFDDLCPEARLGTLSCMAGFEPQRIRPDCHDFIFWKDVMVGQPGVYHRVKK